MSATGTEVFAKDEAVTLRGEATNEAQKDLTTEYAKDVEGVKNVKNEMTVPTAAMKPGETTMGEKNGVSPIPEPATMLLFGVGLATVAGFRKMFLKKG